MTQPVRLQLSRRARFNLQAVSRALNGLPAISCARPGRHGNPFRIGDWMRVGDPDPARSGGFAMAWSRSLIGPSPGYTLIEDGPLAVEFFRRYMAGWSPEYRARKRRELAGHNLACWCAPPDPCHVDPLLEFLAEPAS